MLNWLINFKNKTICSKYNLIPYGLSIKSFAEYKIITSTVLHLLQESLVVTTVIVIL